MGFVPARVVLLMDGRVDPHVRVWTAIGHTDMRRSMNSLLFLVQVAFKRDPHGGDLYVFRGKTGKLIKILWHDGLSAAVSFRSANGCEDQPGPARLVAIEREINGRAPQQRLRLRQERSRPLIAERERRAKLSRNNDTTKAINYCLIRWDAFTRFLD